MTVWQILTDSAIVLCCPLTREYLINYARTLIYTTAMAYPSLVAVRTSYELMQEGKTDSVCILYRFFFSKQLLMQDSSEKISNL